MTENEWSLEDEPVPKKKRRIPRWALFGCGGGCLLLLLVCGVLGFFGVRMAGEFADVEQQWPKLQAILPFDERPTTIVMQGGIKLMGHRQFMLLDKENNLAAILFSSDSDDFDAIFDPDGYQAPMGFGELENPQLGEIEVQGQTCEVLHFTGISGALPFFGDIDQLGAGSWLDLRSAAHPNRILHFRRQGTSKELIPDATVQAFLSHFDAWRN